MCWDKCLLSCLNTHMCFFPFLSSSSLELETTGVKEGFYYSRLPTAQNTIYLPEFKIWAEVCISKGTYWGYLDVLATLTFSLVLWGHVGTIWDFQLFPARIVSVFLVMCGFSGTCDVFVHLNVSCCKFPSQPWELIPVFLLFSISCPPVSRPQRGLKSKINADTAALSRGRESFQDHELSIVQNKQVTVERLSIK